MQASRGFTRQFVRLFTPSVPDVLFCALLLTLCASRSGFEALLVDGDTGWHIRTGQLVLHNGAAPSVDPFSFSRGGEPWFAWEWLTDALFAAVFAWRGMGGVAALTATVLCGAAVLLFAWLLRRESGLWVAAGATLAAVSASSVHYLARPHIFSILLYTASLWILDEERRQPSRRVWLLVPLSALWVNLHGGFVSLLLVLALLAAVSLAERRRSAVKRYAAPGAALPGGDLCESLWLAVACPRYSVPECFVDFGSRPGISIAQYPFGKHGGICNSSAGRYGACLASL